MRFHISGDGASEIIRLGQRRDVVRRALGAFRSFRRTPSSDESDHFTDSGVIVTYSDLGVVTMLEFVYPAQVEVAGVQLLGESLSRVSSLLEARGVRVEIDDIGALLPDLSVEVFAPLGVVEGVQLGSD